MWRAASSTVEALEAGHDVIVCPESELYLDHRAALGPEEPVAVGGLHTIEDVYRYEPAAPEVVAAAQRPGSGRLLGAQAQLWREYLPDARRTDYAAFPRLSAAAESFWSHERDWADFERRLPAELARLDAAGVEYRPLAGPRPWQQRPALRGRAIGEP
ncbi:family 20 glycosylhydrolase [Salana multivorans]